MISVWKAILIGLLQGLTEFLPVSSSGHIALMEHYLAFNPEGGIMFSVILHAGTLLATIVVFRKTIAELLGYLFFEAPRVIAANGFRSAFMSDRRGAMILFIFVGSIPTGIIGFLFEDRLEAMSSSIPFVCIALAITGGIVFSTRYIERMKIRKQGLSVATALLIGFAQGVAITPGISRSGSTISAGMWAGLDRRASGEFSFLLSLPAIMGALILEMRDIADASAASIPAGACPCCSIARTSTAKRCRSSRRSLPSSAAPGA